MAINDGRQSILCNKIVLNPKKKVEIIEPNKGKIVNETKFEEIKRKKMQEIQNRRTNRNDGNSMQIRIGG
ncbi:hypothetical protein [uncultured Aquimarina sp.]|uniref:hypothetical protein n=1 Tax=uncultured Aquimarina sp. TaxID=575652 RepID=UPI00262117EF|nr:hypothetical protein [uncultured Aquimarina sp.]